MADPRRAELENNIKRAEEKIAMWQAKLDAPTKAEEPKKATKRAKKR